jgi:hypothetical protein
VEILAFADKVLQAVDSNRLIEFAQIVVVDGKAPIDLILVLDVVVVNYELVDIIINASFTYHYILALLQKLELLSLQHIVVLLEMGLHRFLQPFTHLSLHCSL